MHDLHLWGLTPQSPVASLHVVVTDTGIPGEVLERVQAYLLDTTRSRTSRCSWKAKPVCRAACLVDGDG
ncbi:hypothetical protein ACU8V3_02480 [Cobetia marina]